MSKFIYWQAKGGEDAWQEALVSGREELVKKHHPAFITALALSTLVIEGQSREETEAIKYAGFFYADFDGESLEQVVPKWKEFLAQLQGYDVDLNMVRLYATGGRGFHCEIPMEMFLAKVPKDGVVALPYIWREVAFDLYVDTLDLNVYSARRGRMWRCPGEKRANGLYKVPLTPEEALNLSVDDYKRLCSTPRQPAPLKLPVLNQKLAVLYAKAEQKVAAGLKRRTSSAKDAKLLEQFKGQFPPSLLKVMAGEAASENLGFHPIAMQIAITANALGVAKDKTIALCAGLLQNHQSDSSRYNTPAKRQAEIERLYDYTCGNPCYTYSRGAVKSLLPKGTPTPDLDGVSEEAGETAPGGNAMSEGLYFTDTGIYRKTDEGSQIISEMSFKDVVMLVDAETEKKLGFEVDVYVSGQPKGRKELRSEHLVSKSTLQRFMAVEMTGFKGTDNHVSALMSVLRRTAEVNNNVIYQVHREGLDMIQRPDTDEDIQDLIWVSPEGIHTESPLKYMLRGDAGAAGIYKSDLMNAPEFDPSEDAAQVIESLCNLNEPYAIANMLGWYASCFHKQLWQREAKEFPLLHVFGTAGSGKTQSYLTIAPLFYYKNEPHLTSVANGTAYGLKAMMYSSASLPAFLDEYKPQSMPFFKAQELKNFLRSSYNSSEYSKGGHADGLGTSWKDVRVFQFSAPVVYCSEAMETETALLERSIVIPLSKSGFAGREGHQGRVMAGRRVI